MKFQQQNGILSNYKPIYHTQPETFKHSPYKVFCVDCY